MSGPFSAKAEVSTKPGQLQGARAWDVIWLVLQNVLVLTAIGVVLGFAIAGWFSQLLVSFLYQTSPLDLTTFIAVVFFTIGCTVLAAFIPTMRAMSVDPAVSLRYE